MEFFKQNKIYNFMKLSNLMIVVTLILSVASIAIFFTKGLNYGIDFVGGTEAQVRYKGDAPIDKIRELTKTKAIFHDATVTEFGSKQITENGTLQEVSIRFTGSSDNLGNDVGDQLNELLQGTGEYEIRQVNMVGPKVGEELRKKGIMSIVVALIAILAYIAIRFEWRFGLAAVISQFHDVILIIGVIVFLQIDVKLEILAAVLTLLAYSLNDTIVVFDRIRDEIKKAKTNNLSDIIDLSVSKTLSRTVLTSLTTLLVVLALLIFGGESIKGFALTLAIGIVIGTYSSIFIAAPLLKWLRFDVAQYKANIVKKEKARLEKEKMRSMYEKGIV